MKVLKRRVLRQIKRARTWLDQAEGAYTKGNLQEGEKRLHLALAELSLAAERGRFWAYQVRKHPDRRRRRLPLVVACVVFALLLVGGVAVNILVGPGTSEVRISAPEYGELKLAGDIPFLQTGEENVPEERLIFTNIETGQGNNRPVLQSGFIQPVASGQ